VLSIVFERQRDGHQQLRQPDTSFSDEHDTVESTPNLRINEQQQVDTRQTLVVDDKTQTDEQILQTEEVDTTKETISDKKKSLKDTMKEKAKKLKKFIETKSTSSKKQKDVRMNHFKERI
jgi:hypothetical protein